ncbi:MAG: DEAD/DEAH box helicase [Candidatus Gracilibacteria bacterium]|nr:DEAD/DEAH box helicase [Candidatus Gracilibacteria bacterium]
MNFNELNLISPILKALEKEGFSTPTEIQEKVIPIALENRDVLGCARTGSGKTFAFALPTLQLLYNKRLEKGLVEGKIKRNIKALVLAPTRELAIQIGEAFAPYCTNTNFKHTVIFGGVNQFHQVKAIEKGVDILIATPGRLEDLISQGVIKLSYVEILTIDEADRMLDLGSLQDLKKILKRLPEERHTFLFSATMPKEIGALANSILKNPETITVHTVSTPTDKIKQKVYFLSKNFKRQLLQQICKRKDLDSILVFVNTIIESERVHEFMKMAGIKCDFINKNKTQNQRQKALDGLKNGDIKVLIATDIASRGLDINSLSCVVNYELPGDGESYVHRIGRTARAGKDGLAISFCSETEKEKFEKIKSLVGNKIEVVNDESYKEEIVPKGRTSKIEQINEKTKPKTRKKRDYSKMNTSEKREKSSLNKKTLDPKKENYSYKKPKPVTKKTSSVKKRKK